MARRRLTGRELARRTGKSQPYWSRRLTGEVAFDVDDLSSVAAYLEVPVVSFFRDGGANSYYDGCAGQATAYELAA